jgi:hypothetical protein
MRTLFVCTPSKAYGEVNAAIPLARGVVDRGGEVWFIASPLAADVAWSAFPGRVFTLTGDRQFNQSLFWRVCGKFRPDLIVFVELYEILRPGRKPDCPLIDSTWLRRIDSIPAEFVFLDFIVHVPLLREIADCIACSRRFDRPALRTFLSRLRVMLPCPLNEPGPVEGRCGIPYRTDTLPFEIDPDTRARARARFLSEADEQEGFLILRTGATWQSVLADKYRVRLYEKLSELLSFYFGSTSRRVTLVSISSHHTLSPVNSNLRIVNESNLPPSDFSSLVLSCDLVITDNEIGYVLAKTLGRVPGLVLVNSFRADEILARERNGSPVARVIHQLESYRCGAVYPHKIFPIPAGPDQFLEERRDPLRRQELTGTSRLRLGRMVSSPFVKAEIYGGEETRCSLASLVDDSTMRRGLRKQESAYIERLSKLRSGAEVLAGMLRQAPNSMDTVLS